MTLSWNSPDGDDDAGKRSQIPRPPGYFPEPPGLGSHPLRSAHAWVSTHHLFPFIIRNARSLSQKLEQRFVKLRRLLDLRDVAAMLDHKQLGSSDAITKFFAAGQRN